MGNRSVIVLFVLLLLAVASIGLHAHFVRQGCEQTLLWTNDDAYLFVDMTTFGYDFTYFGYGLELIKEYFGAPGPSKQRHTTVTVIHITPSNIERTALENLSLHPYTATALGIFANRQGTIVKWSGSAFEPVSDNQQEALRKLLFEPPREFENREGWSKKEGLSGFDGESKYNLPLDGAPATLSVKADHARDTVEISLERLNRPAQQIHFCPQGPRRVSAAEYDKIFR